MRSTGRTPARAATAGGLAALLGATPAAALHPGHGEHVGLLGGAFHVLLQSGAGFILLGLIAVALLARGRAIR